MKDATTKATIMETTQQVGTFILGEDGLIMNVAHKNSEETKGSNLENDKEPVSSSSSETEHTSQLPRVTDSTVKLIGKVIHHHFPQLDFLIQLKIIMTVSLLKLLTL